jgi:HEAT repeat protein
MVKALLLLVLAQASPQDRVAPLLERWRRGREDERLQALREAAALRADAGDDALEGFAKAPVPESWTRADDLIDLVSREKIVSWYGLLVPLVSSRDPAVRVRALEELGRRELFRYADFVIPKLRDPDRRTAWQAAYTLIQMDARGRVRDLVALLKDPEASVRPNVVHALLRLGEREHAPLLEPYLEDADPAVAIAAVEILGRIGAFDSAPRILPFLKASDPSQRQTAIAALASMGARGEAPKIAERLGDEMMLVRWEAVRALGRLGAREYAGRIAESLEEDGGLAPGLEALGKLGVREQAPHIVPFLETPDPGIRWRAVRALGEVDAAEDSGRIAGMLKDPDSFVRLCALQALAALGAREHAGAMLALLRDEEFEVCQGAADETCLLASDKQLRELRPLLGDEDSFVRWTALRLLVGAGAKDALPDIVARLGRGPELNRDIVWAIGRLGGKDQRDLMAGALRNDDGLVRQQAAFALARLSERRDELEEADRAAPGPTQLAAAFALVRLGRKDRAAAAALLREFVRHQDDPDYQRFPDEIFDALAAGFEKEASAALSREVKTLKRIDSLQDLAAVVSKAGVILASRELPPLRRRLPAGLSLPARRALEWSFGGDGHLVPSEGRVGVMDSARALEHWQKRLDAK